MPFSLKGDFGPLEPSLPIDVPLWLAVYLKKLRKCQIQQPDWMSVGSLTILKPLKVLWSNVLKTLLLTLS